MALYLGADPAETAAVAVELRYEDGRLASLRALGGREARMRLALDCALGVVELKQTGRETVCTVSRHDGTQERVTIDVRGSLTVEAERVAGVMRGADRTDEPVRAAREGAVLHAVEAALDSGAIVAYETAVDTREPVPHRTPGGQRRPPVAGGAGCTDTASPARRDVARRVPAAS